MPKGNEVSPNRVLKGEQTGLTTPPKAEVTGSNPVGCAILHPPLFCAATPSVPRAITPRLKAIFAVIEGAEGVRMRGRRRHEPIARILSLSLVLVSLSSTGRFPLASRYQARRNYFLEQ